MPSAKAAKGQESLVALPMGSANRDPLTTAITGQPGHLLNFGPPQPELVKGKKFSREVYDDPKDPVVISLKRVYKRYRIYKSEGDQFISLFSKKHRQKLHRVTACEDLTFKIKRGEIVQICGPSGSGCSTVVGLINGTRTPTSGKVRINGRVAVLRPTMGNLNKRFTGRHNIIVCGRLLGFSKQQIAQLLPLAIEFSGLGKAIDRPMTALTLADQEKVLLSVLANVDLDLLVIEGRVGAVDKRFLAKFRKRMSEILAANQATVVFTGRTPSLNNPEVTRFIQLEKGRLVFDGDAEGCREFERQRKRTVALESWSAGYEEQIATAVAAARRFWPKGARKALVTTCTAANTALREAYLMSVLDAPILFLPPVLAGAKQKKAAQQVAAALKELEVKELVAIGDDGSLADEVVESMEVARSHRIYGASSLESTLASVEYALSGGSSQKTASLGRGSEPSLVWQGRGLGRGNPAYILVASNEFCPSLVEAAIVAAERQLPLVLCGAPLKNFVFPEAVKDFCYSDYMTDLVKAYLCGDEEELSGNSNFTPGIGSTESNLRLALGDARVQRLATGHIQDFFSGEHAPDLPAAGSATVSARDWPAYFHTLADLIADA